MAPVAVVEGEGLDVVCEGELGRERGCVVRGGDWLGVAGEGVVRGWTDWGLQGW